MTQSNRRPQISILGSAEPGSVAYERAGEAGELLAQLGITVVSGCGSPATRVAAERAIAAGGIVLSIVPPRRNATSRLASYCSCTLWHGGCS